MIHRFGAFELDLAQVELRREGRPVAVSASGARIVLVRRGDRVLALEDRCSHEAQPLSDGYVDGLTIECAECRYEVGVVKVDPNPNARAASSSCSRRVRSGLNRRRRSEKRRKPRPSGTSG